MTPNRPWILSRPRRKGGPVVTSCLRNSFGRVAGGLSAPRCRHERRLAFGNSLDRIPAAVPTTNLVGGDCRDDTGLADVLEAEVVSSLPDLTGVRVLVVDDDVTVSDVLTL
jgi:hypothetical protein